MLNTRNLHCSVFLSTVKVFPSYFRVDVKRNADEGSLKIVFYITICILLSCVDRYIHECRVFSAHSALKFLNRIVEDEIHK